MSAKQTGKGLLFFAPLQGFTEAPYRKAHHEVCGGGDAYYAPFVRLEKGEIRKKDLRDISFDFPCPFRGKDVSSADRKGATVPQLIAADAEEFEQLARAIIGQGHRHVDLNLGCPFAMQTRAGRGAGLLPHRDMLQAIAGKVRQLQDEYSLSLGGERVPEGGDRGFSIKMRLGLESADECLALLPILNEMPLTHIVMHPRLGKQQYRGEVDLLACRRFMEGLAHPLVYNGDICSLEDAERVLAELPGLSGLMIGRGLLARPTLAAELRSGQLLPDCEVRKAVLEIHARVLSDYAAMLEGGEAQVLQKMLPFWEYQEPLFGHKAVKLIRKSRTLADYKRQVAALAVR